MKQKIICPPPFFSICRRGRPYTVNPTHQICIHRGADVFFGIFKQRAFRSGDSSIVHPHIDATEMGNGAIGERFNLKPARHICGDGQCAAAGGVDLGFVRINSIRVARRENNVSATPDKLERDSDSPMPPSTRR